MPLPTFLILGAQKCGTSSLAGMLRHHPEIMMSRPKEMHYFDRKPVGDLEWYAAQFKPRPHHVAWGEATPSYLFLDSARDRIVEALPEAKFVVLLRDPAKRAYSHFWHNHRLGVETTDSFEDALDHEVERMTSTRRNAGRRYSYQARGRYIEQLTAWEELVGRDRLHVALLEDLSTSREATLAGIFNFLGVDPTRAAVIPEQHRVPKSGGNGVANTYPPLSTETRQRLVRDLESSIRALESWLGRSLDAWLTI